MIQRFSSPNLHLCIVLEPKASIQVLVLICLVFCFCCDFFFLWLLQMVDIQHILNWFCLLKKIDYLSWFWLLLFRWSLQVSPAGQMSHIKAVSLVESGSLDTGWKWRLTIVCLALVVNSAFPSVRQRICFGFHYWKKLMQSMWTLLLREVKGGTILLYLLLTYFIWLLWA